MEALTVGSLFAGIGGFDLGFERAGMRTLWQVEQNEFCRRVLERHFPTAHRFNDVREVTGSIQRWESEGGTLLEYVDVLCGGFPCQDISSANPNAVGIAGERSGLWSEYARLVGELRPRYVVVENVSILTSRGLGVVLGDLAALGYDAEWDCVPASAAGAPHQRDRIWIIAYPSSSGREPGVADLHAGESDASGRGSHPDADTGRLEVSPQRDVGSIEPGQRAPLGRDVDGLRDHVADASRDAEAGTAPPPGAVGQRARARGQHRGASAVQDAPGEGRPATRRERPGDAESAGPLGIAARSDWWATEPDVGRVAHGVPARVDRLAALGNALVPQIAEWIGRRIIEWEGGVDG